VAARLGVLGPHFDDANSIEPTGHSEPGPRHNQRAQLRRFGMFLLVRGHDQLRLSDLSFEAVDL
jgi:hypothetical protein